MIEMDGHIAIVARFWPVADCQTKPDGKHILCRTSSAKYWCCWIAKSLEAYSFGIGEAPQLRPVYVHITAKRLVQRRLDLRTKLRSVEAGFAIAVSDYCRQDQPILLYAPTESVASCALNNFSRLR